MKWSCSAQDVTSGVPVPVEPNPPAPRSVESRDSTTTTSGVEMRSSTNCAMRSPASTAQRTRRYTRRIPKRPQAEQKDTPLAPQVNGQSSHMHKSRTKFGTSHQTWTQLPPLICCPQKAVPDASYSNDPAGTNDVLLTSSSVRLKSKTRSSPR